MPQLPELMRQRSWFHVTRDWAKVLGTLAVWSSGDSTTDRQRVTDAIQGIPAPAQETPDLDGWEMPTGTEEEKKARNTKLRAEVVRVATTTRRLILRRLLKHGMPESLTAAAGNLAEDKERD